MRPTRLPGATYTVPSSGSISPAISTVFAEQPDALALENLKVKPVQYVFILFKGFD
jgi:hypothetical protein